jgi:hypothetical protein
MNIKFWYENLEEDLNDKPRPWEDNIKVDG